jgi:carboxyl-terminal processing protease
MLAEDNGMRVGLGITVGIDESGYIVIGEILEKSPLADSDIKAGDIIVAVDGKDVLKEGYNAAVDAMKGEEGTDVRITIRRDGIDTAYTFKRTAIEIESVSYEMLDNYIGYIKISSFKKNTPEQFADALETLTSNSVKALIFDVRDNVGGLVTSLEKCVDPLLPEGVIANAVYKDNHEETLVYSDESEIEIPMVVLVNGNTASAAELFAASLKDFDKADIVGEQTFGKGVMQSVYKLDDGSAVSVTVAEYKTTVSDCYNGIGIAPDHIVPTSDEDKTDLQLSKAIEVINELD